MQDHEGKTTQEWHNYACLWWSSAGQQQISQLTLIIDNLIKLGNYQASIWAIGPLAFINILELHIWPRSIPLFLLLTIIVKLVLVIEINYAIILKSKC